MQVFLFLRHSLLDKQVCPMYNLIEVMFVFDFTGVLLNAVNSAGAAGYADPVGTWFKENSGEAVFLFVAGFILGAITVLIINYLIKLSREDKASLDDAHKEDKDEPKETKEYKNKRG